MRGRQLGLAAVIGATAASAGCAGMMPPAGICYAPQAHATGKEQALAGRPMDMSPGQACSGEHAQVFADNLQRGYEEGRQERCDPARLRQRARSRGERGLSAEFRIEGYDICADPASLQAAYEDGYALGLGSYCSEDRVAEIGTEHGERGVENDFAREEFSACEAEQLDAMEEASERAYEAALSDFCAAPAADEVGASHAAQGRPPDDLHGAFRLCSPRERRSALARYRAGYERGLRALCDDSAIRAAAEEAAAAGPDPVAGPPVRTCLERLPDRRRRFERWFARERAAIVSSECTFERGYRAGRADADRGEDTSGDLPPFCNPRAYPRYRRGYREGLASSGASCDSRIAFDDGERDALRGRAPRYEPPASCRRERRDLRDAYLEGYRAGRIEDGQRACRDEGFSSRSCRRVTSRTCIERGYRPRACELPTEHAHAVDACIREGYRPRACERVRDAECVRSGHAPSRCR